jgi:DNA-binding NtrC family response regulator
VIVINLPPLRDRKEDIPLLIEHFLKQYARDKDRPTIPGRVVEMLRAYHWPGNIRELQNELQRYLTEQRLEFIGNLEFESGERNEMSDLMFNQEGSGFRETVEMFEKRLIARVLEQNSGHTGKTAAILALPLRTLYRKMKKYQLS